MDTLKKIETAGYHVTPPDVEALTLVVLEGGRADGTYLKVLIAETVAATHGKRRTAQLLAFEKIATGCYLGVLKAVDGFIGQPTATDNDAVRLHALRRNSMGGFARSAASTIRSALKAGLDLRTVDLATVTKAWLRAQVVPAGTSEALQAAWTRAHDRVIAFITTEARTAPEAAQERVTELIAELQALALPTVVALPKVDGTVKHHYSAPARRSRPVGLRH